MKRFMLILAVLVASVWAMPGSAVAAEFRGNEEATTVPAGQTVEDDLYIAGQTVTVSGTINGDLVAAGSDVTVNGTVTGSVWVAGGTVTINGSVGHSLRVAGGTVTINGSVTNDVLVGGGQVTVSQEATIGRDLATGSGELTVNGSVGRDIRTGSDRITLAGPVKGSVTARSGEQFTVASGANIAGGISYSGPVELNRQEGATVAGQIAYTKTERESPQSNFLERLAGQAYWFIASVLLLLAILLYARRAAVRAADLLIMRPGTSVLVGLAFVILAPIVGFIFLITIFGIPLSLITFLGYGLVLYSAKLFPALAVGRAALRGKTDSFWPTFGAGVLGLAAFYVLTALPFIGWLVTLTALLFGTGAQLLLFREVYGFVRKKYGV